MGIASRLASTTTLFGIEVAGWSISLCVLSLSSLPAFRFLSPRFFLHVVPRLGVGVIGLGRLLFARRRLR